VIISAGGLSGILNVLLTVIDVGDEVVLTDPTYIGLINRVRLAGGVPRLVPLVRDGDGWTLDRDEFRNVITLRTRACLFMSPSMPSGAVFTQQDWEVVAEVVIGRKLWLIHDAAMQRILFDAHRVIDPAGLPGLAARTITVGCASKELRMIGWRVGWIVAPEEVVCDLALVSMTNVVVPVGFAQDAAADALRLGDADVAKATATWEVRRDGILRELREIPVTRPSGGWSLLVDASQLGKTGRQLSHLLFDRGHIAATPMDGWGVVNGARMLRLVFSKEPIHRLEGLGETFRRAALP
jgi:N-succinyldiaminopimelate aminotransferase